MRKSRFNEQQNLAVAGLDDGVHELVPDAGFPPPIEAIVDRRRRPVTLEYIAPRRAGAQDVEDPVENTPVVDTRHAARLVRQQRLDHTPLEVRQVMARHD
jgi:hypothetical protein